MTKIKEQLNNAKMQHFESLVKTDLKKSNNYEFEIIRESFKTVYLIALNLINIGENK